MALNLHMHTVLDYGTCEMKSDNQILTMAL